MQLDHQPRCWKSSERSWGGAWQIPESLGLVRSIQTAKSYACAVKQDCSVVCWGMNWDKQTDVPEGLRVSDCERL